MNAPSSDGDGPVTPEATQRAPPKMCDAAPPELTAEALQWLGEGIGKVAYASPHWVVKRERSPQETIALIWLWKLIRQMHESLPGKPGKRLLDGPTTIMRMLRVVTQAVGQLVPRRLWRTSRSRDIWKLYHYRAQRGERLARTHLAGTPLIPRTITFPPTLVRIASWRGWMLVREATERAEDTLHRRLVKLARRHRFDEVEMWLDRLLDLRQQGWQRGVFSVDAHLKNFGVIDERVVLIDPGGLTNRLEEIEVRLADDRQAKEPHIALGLGPILRLRPDIAQRFNERWRATVNIEQVRSLWRTNATWPASPTEPPPSRPSAASRTEPSNA